MWRLIVISALTFLAGAAVGYVLRGSVGEPERQGGGVSTLTLKAIEDAYVSQENPDTNYGTAGELRTDSDPEIRSYLRFELEGLVGTVRRATLRIYAETANSDGYDIRLVTGEWREDSVTYSSGPRVGSLIATSSSFGGLEWVSVDVTLAAQQRGTLDLAVTSISETNTRYSSREGSNSPELIVETTGSQGQSGEASGGQNGAMSPAGAVAAEAQPGQGIAPSSPDDPVIAAAGDIACDPARPDFNNGRGTDETCRMSLTANLILSAGVDLVLALGDLQYEKGELANFRRSYDLSWGRLNTITRPALGNHEYGTKDAAGYFAYFGSAAGDPSEGYYSFDLGSWHLIALNSNCSKVGGCGIGSPQGDWLAGDLAESASACTLAYWHHPRFSSGEHGGNAAYDAFWQPLYNEGADVILNGHDHDYERFAPMAPSGEADPGRGIRQFVVGTGGSNLRDLVSIQPNSEVRTSDTFGVLTLRLHPTSYDWRFVAESGASFTDEGNGLCH